ncbi:hypothetical protein NUZ5A_51260 [Candidatus Nitrosotenuis uzonensis]|uniref:Uncharacterized protein n=1 Tax=Candidatus Nitrosotenuis uzonensis TaxID=1407055 RepID=A0A812EYD0_9ARCH|nr:hypothetical protein NUZ5A_51260 [Candidatus Nitrosotenuis uzonensis]
MSKPKHKEVIQSMLTLFTKESSIRNLKDPHLKYGYSDKKKRPALKDMCYYGHYNKRGFRLSIDRKKGTISLSDKKKMLFGNGF